MHPCRFLTRVVLLMAIPLAAPGQQPVAAPPDLSLNGMWQIGVASGSARGSADGNTRHYDATASVPGLPQDPTKPSPGTLWYRRSVQLPGGDWQQATLTLNGARFHPEVFIDGESVGASEGGMAPLHFLLKTKAIRPGATITLEISLRSLNDVSLQDASTTPEADRWRSNVSSGLWDDVSLHFSGGERLVTAIPFPDFGNRTLAVHWQAEPTTASSTLRTEITDVSGKVIAGSESPATGSRGMASLQLPDEIQSWSPDHPRLYRLRVTLLDRGHPEDIAESPWGLRQFETREKRFYLNGEPIELLGGTVVWHRFLRTPGAAEVAFDTGWFERNIAARLKSYGANTLRWHLGLPPERLLDMCDRDGLMVQLEWPFFHAIPATVPSMAAQWKSWLDVAMRHPSVVLVHPWNETGDPAAIRNAYQALNSILPDYPALVVAHRDTVHIHKYWWSLFENLGLYYDNVNQFDQTAMVDEFGGNYLDTNGDPGLYPSTKESFLRFLGREQTKELRLAFHAESNARVAEYWRRIGAHGILPFCILGGPQDGSSWFLGSLKDPEPMPVWDALAAAWSPISLSLDVWDRNYLPGQTLALPLHTFNDTGSSATLSIEVRVVDRDSHQVVANVNLRKALDAHQHQTTTATLTLPDRAGNYRLEAALLNPPANVHHPVVSSWEIRTLTPQLPAALSRAHIALAGEEPELAALLAQNGLTPVALSDPGVNLILGSSATWKALTEAPGPGQSQASALRGRLADAIHRGVSVVLLDIGPRDLGEGYRAQSLGSLEGAPVVRDPYTVTADLFDGVHLTFHQQAEPESHIQPAPDNRDLWQNLPTQATWIWNGLRGGLIAPSADMEVSGLSQAALTSQWKEHGADPDLLRSGKPYYAYNLAGYYAYSQTPADQPIQNALRARVRFLAEDAPALKDVLNPNAPIDQIDLAGAYRNASQAHAQSLQPLSTCGKNLTRAEIVQLSFGTQANGEPQGNLLLSQALTAGRLKRGAAGTDFYGIRYDPAAEQFTLNMLAEALRK